ncbi:hypothetical protein JW859_04420 [bacterium]|nr:hypothetical protein [bacterium]
MLAAWLFACGGGSGDTQPQVQPEQSAPDLQLSLTATPLDANRIVVSLTAADADELYQLSCRVTYDPAVVQPVSAVTGVLVDERAAVFTSTQPADYVPCAFTYHPGESMPAAQGELFSVEFTLADPAATPQFGLVTDAEFLIANDNTGRRLAASVEVQP